MGIRTYSNKAPKAKGAMQTLYFNPQQTKEILRIAGSAGFVLMQHYVAIAHQTNPNMEDNTLAGMLNMKEAQVKKLRLKLTKAEWFSRVRSTVNGDTQICYAVGKEAVQQPKGHSVKLGV